MRAGRGFRLLAGVFGFVAGTAIVTAQTAEIEAELRARLAALQAKQAQPDGKAKAKPIAPVRAPAADLPAGAIARVGDSPLRHAAQPRCVLFAPDGKRAYSGGEDGMLRVWDVATGRAAAPPLHFPSATVTALRYAAGGSKLVVQLDGEKLRFLDAATLKPFDDREEATAAEFALSPDATLLATVTPAGALQVTELSTRLPKLDLPAARAFAFHPDGKSIAVADDKGKVTLHMLAGGKPLMALDAGGPVASLLFRPDGRRLLTGGSDVLKVWDVADRKNPKLLTELAGASRPKAWLSDDRIAAATAFTGNSFTAGVYSLAERKWVGQAHGVSVEWAASPDGTRAITVADGSLRVYLRDLTTGAPLHTDNVSFPDVALLAPTADGKHVHVVTGEATRFWAVGEPVAAPVGMLPRRGVAAVSANRRLVVATTDEILVYDDFDPAKVLPAKPSRTLAEHAVGCKALAISPDGKKVAYSGSGMKTVIADAATGKALRVLPVQTQGIAVAFDPIGETLAMIGRDGFLRRCDAATGADVWKVRIQRGQRGTVAFSPDGGLIAASSSGTLKMVTASDGAELFSVGGLFDNGLFQDIAFSPDGRLLVTASEGSTGGVIVWEVATRTAVRRYATGFGTVYRLGMFPDGTRVASAGVEEAVTLWDLTGRHGKAAPAADELLAAWADLDSTDGATGYPAARTLAAGGAKGVKVIAAGIDEAADTRKKIAARVKDLASDDFDTREAATKELLALGVRALPAVQQAARASDSPEVRTRATNLLTQYTAKGIRVPDHGLAGDDLRLLRAAQALEDVGGPEAKSLLERIAKLDGPATDAAKAALGRIKMR